MLIIRPFKNKIIFTYQILTEIMIFGLFILFILYINNQKTNYFKTNMIEMIIIILYLVIAFFVGVL